MTLFKKLLLSIFPEHFTGNFWPANVFLSLVKAKDFFTIITKRMVENYKLNLFDIWLESVEIKIWFGNQINIKPKDIEMYYGYCISAHLNGYKFYNPSNVISAVSIAIWYHMLDSFQNNKSGQNLFMNMIFCINILMYIFTSRIKIFPYKDDKDNFNRFVDLFFNQYTEITRLNSKSYLKDIEKIKKEILSKKTEDLFALYYLYKRFGNLYIDDPSDQKQFYQWLFSEDIKKTKINKDFDEFIKNSNETTISSDAFEIEQKMLDNILPVEILVRIFFNRNDAFLVWDHILSKIFDQKVLQDYLKSFLINDDQLDEFIEYTMDHKLYKKWFFDGVKQLSYFKFNKMDPKNQDIEEMISSINDWDEQLQIPESIKKEWALMDRMLNFYISFTTWLWTNRADNNYIRLFKNHLITNILNNAHNIWRWSIKYYQQYLFLYSKSVFYHHMIYDGVRSGKLNFVLPQVVDTKEVYENPYIIKLLDESNICTLLQNINTKEIKINMHKKDILSWFREQFGSTISRYVEQQDMLELYYKTIDDITWSPIVMQSLYTANPEDNTYMIWEKEYKNLKENMYTLDFWIYKDVLDEIVGLKLDKNLGTTAIYGILANLKESIFGFLLLLQNILSKQKNKKSDYRLDALINIYITEILFLSADYVEDMTDIIYDIYTRYKEALEIRVDIDDNKYFLDVWADCWIIYISKEKDIFAPLKWEDMLRFRGFLKNVTYYNKRYIIPKI